MIIPPERRQSLPRGKQFLDCIEEVVTDDSVESELRAVTAFLKQAPLGGMVPARKPYLLTRDEAFIKTWYVGASISQLKPSDAPSWWNGEDAREAIYVGRRAGYREADIAAYLRRNYNIPRPPKLTLWDTRWVLSVITVTVFLIGLGLAMAGYSEQVICGSVPVLLVFGVIAWRETKCQIP